MKPREQTDAEQFGVAAEKSDRRQGNQRELWRRADVPAESGDDNTREETRRLNRRAASAFGGVAFRLRHDGNPEIRDRCGGPNGRVEQRCA